MLFDITGSWKKDLWTKFILDPRRVGQVRNSKVRKNAGQHADIEKENDQVQPHRVVRLLVKLRLTTQSSDHPTHHFICE